MGRSIYSRVSLLKWSIPPYNFGRRYDHDADQQQILEEVLSLTGLFSWSGYTTPLIKASLWSIRWIRIWDPRCLEERQRRAFSFNGSHHGRSMSNQPNIIDITMHDVNIKETKLETSVLAVTFFMIRLTLHLWSKPHPDQSDELGLEIQDAWKSAKKNFFLQDRIMVDRCRTDRILLTSRCMMLILKRQS